MLKKYGHIKTRLDEMMERDKLWKFHLEMREWVRKKIESYKILPMYICGGGK